MSDSLDYGRWLKSRIYTYNLPILLSTCSDLSNFFLVLTRMSSTQAIGTYLVHSQEDYLGSYVASGLSSIKCYNTHFKSST